MLTYAYTQVFPFDCYPYEMSNPWVLSAFESFSTIGHAASSRCSDTDTGVPDMTHGHVWDRMLGGSDDGALERAEEALAAAKLAGEISGSELALLARSVANLRASSQPSGTCSTARFLCYKS